MDWANIINIIIGVVTALVAGIGLPIALRKRKKQGPHKGEELLLHLQGIGLNTYLPSEETIREKTGFQRFSSTRLLYVIGIKEKNIQWINLIGISSQYGTNYYIDFQVNSPNLEIRKPKKTYLRIKKHSNPKHSSINWAGDKSFSLSLRFDYRLEELILKSEFQGSLEISPELKKGYIRIRIPYALFSTELFEAINLIAGHIKSEF